MQAYSEIDIKNILEINDYNIVLLFENFEIKTINFKDFLKKFPQAAKINQQILSPKHWKTIKIDQGTIFFPNILNGYHVAPDSLYKDSQTTNIKPQYLSVLRKSKGITQAKLARKIRISQSELSQLETGKTNNLKIMAKALSILL